MARNDRVAEGKRSRQTGERRASFPRSVPKAAKRDIGRSTTRETPLQIRARDAEVDDTLRDYMRRRAGFKLGKFALNIVRITVRSEQGAGPNGAPMHDCRFVVVLTDKREVVVAVGDASARAAFDSAVEATERAVRRRLQRGRTRSERAPRAGGPQVTSTMPVGR